MSSNAGEIIRQINKVPVFGVDPEVVAYSARLADSIATIESLATRGSLLFSQAQDYTGFWSEVNDWACVIGGCYDFRRQGRYDIQSRLIDWLQEFSSLVSELRSVTSLGLQVSADLAQKYDRDFSKFFQS